MTILKRLLVLVFSFSLMSLSCAKTAGTRPPSPPAAPVTPPRDSTPSLATVRSWLVDKNATAESAALFYNLKRIAKTNVMFGHQDDTKRGYNWANEQQFPGVSREKSDIREITGAYPLVYGHDFLHIANFADGLWYDYEKQIAHDLTVDAYNRGGVNTYCWHYANPVSKGSFYWSESPVEAVSKILPGGSEHAVYTASLLEVANHAKSLVGADGKLVPVIFRPYHEFDGDWFWWGKAHCSAADYISLYQFTVKYLRDSLGVHNFIYAWSPDRNFNSEVQYLDRYPGDDYVDLVGIDNYGDLAAGISPSVASAKLKIVSDYAIAKNKIAALTETGLANLTKIDWYTQVLAKALQLQKLEIAYALVWANTANTFWTPYKGHAAEPDFIAFKNNPYFLFSDKTPVLYELK